MSDMHHVISIIAHVVQTLASVAFLFLMWKWSRPQGKSEKPKEQADAAERCMNLRNQLEEKHLEETLNCRYCK